MLDFRLVILNMGRGPRTGSSLARHGFTLVEMMVVLAILMVLGAMTVAILPSVTEGQYTIQAATQLQQWFEIAKQNAARDRAPRGVRLMPNPVNPMQIINLEFLEQPPPFTLGDLPNGTPSLATSNGSGNIVMFSATSVKKFTFAGAAPGLEPVRGGDYLELAGMIYRIQPGMGSVSDRQLTLTSQPPAITTSNYRVIRQPRPMGDEPLEMPKNTAIDLTGRVPADARWLPPPPIQGVITVDIMFGPDGRVLGGMAAREKIIFWVRDVTLPEPNGEPTLVVIYPATGLIATHPVDIGFFQGEPGVTPYTFTSTGKRSSQ